MSAGRARARPPASCSGSSTPTRSCSPACCSPRGASATASAATASSPSASPSSASARRCRRSRRRPTMLIVHPRAHGHRRRVHHAVDAVDHHERVHRPGRARQGDRRLGRRVRARHRPRPDHRRLPARALLVGLGLHRERADRDRRPGARLLPRPRVARPVARRARPGRRGAVDRRARLDPVGGHRGAEPRLGRRRRSSPASSIGFVLLAAFFVWELHSSHPMLDMHFFENPRFSAASGAITLVFLVAVRHAVPADAVPAVGARLLDGRRPARCCCRRRP